MNLGNMGPLAMTAYAVLSLCACAVDPPPTLAPEGVRSADSRPPEHRRIWWNAEEPPHHVLNIVDVELGGGKATYSFTEHATDRGPKEWGRRQLERVTNDPSTYVETDPIFANEHWTTQIKLNGTDWVVWTGERNLTLPASTLATGPAPVPSNPGSEYRGTIYRVGVGRSPDFLWHAQVRVDENAAWYSDGRRGTGRLIADGAGPTRVYRGVASRINRQELTSVEIRLKGPDWHIYEDGQHIRTLRPENRNPVFVIPEGPTLTRPE
jgi:hypothetical protein